MSMTATEGLRSSKVCRRTGVSYRELIYWTRAGIVTPSVFVGHGSGSWHLWSETDVTVIAVLKALREHGIDLWFMRGVARVLRPHLDEAPVESGQVLVIPSGAGDDTPRVVAAEDVPALLRQLGNRGMFVTVAVPRAPSHG